MMSTFNNTVVVITGAASGIGRALTLHAASRGAAVIATDNNGALLEETRSLAHAQGYNITATLLDVADADAIVPFAQEVIRQLQNRKLVLINNAGVALLSGTFADTDLADFDWLLQINLWGAIRLTKAFYPYLLQQNKGHIVNISSVFGLVGIMHQSAYCTAKFAVRGFTETLRMELAGTGIGTTVVHPGGVNTNIVRHSRVNQNITTPDVHQQSITRFAQKAITTPENAAKQILDAVERKKTRLVIGKDGRQLDLLARWFPVGYTNFVKKRIGKVFGNPYIKQ
jgi:butyryl-CoA dehydrogenase